MFRGFQRRDHQQVEGNLPMLLNRSDDLAKESRRIDAIEHGDKLQTEFGDGQICQLGGFASAVNRHASAMLAYRRLQYGSKMKEVSAVINSFSKEEISQIEKTGTLAKGGFDLVLEDVLISSQDIPGWSVASEAGITVALDVTITPELKREGVARDFVNRVQNMRKDIGLEVLDKIGIEVEKDGELATSSLNEFKEYICSETQALSLELKDKLQDATEVDMDEFVLKIKIKKF